MAAMLLSCASAFAQSGNNTPAKGDVNEDGTVDVADIVNVIKIMKEGGGAVGEKMSYWYAGTNNGNAVTADNFTDVASRIPESEVPETGSVTANGQYVYFVMPKTKHLESLTDGNGSAVEFTCTYVMEYRIYKTNDKINGSINYSVIQTVYYWYAGQTNPLEMNEISPILSGDNEFTSGSGWHALGETLPESIDQLVKGGTAGQIWYAAIPVDAQLVAGSSADPDTSVTQGSVVTIPSTNGVQYQIWINEGVTGTRYNATFNK